MIMSPTYTVAPTYAGIAVAMLVFEHNSDSKLSDAFTGQLLKSVMINKRILHGSTPSAIQCIVA